jgi:hypothetical protein
MACVVCGKNSRRRVGCFACPLPSSMRSSIGPEPPDTIWFVSPKKAEFDAALAQIIRDGREKRLTEWAPFVVLVVLAVVMLLCVAMLFVASFA